MIISETQNVEPHDARHGKTYIYIAFTVAALTVVYALLPILALAEGEELHNVSKLMLDQSAWSCIQLDPQIWRVQNR
jgi:hypothetical protein